MSSLAFLGISIITLVTTYGISFILTPMITGAFFSAVDTSLITTNSGWLEMYENNENTVKYLVPLIPAFSILIVVIKVLMTSAARGRN